jgi:hypothetical protein
LSWNNSGRLQLTDLAERLDRQAAFLFLVVIAFKLALLRSARTIAHKANRVPLYRKSRRSGSEATGVPVSVFLTKLRSRLLLQPETPNQIGDVEFRFIREI